ncbi:fibronectin type 3 and ankyrin repeat domains 1 protein-like [Mytilus trossulus]|uniref:fibronectin type 3 and ankyrin repeat domains 1 protein-like n=1 Tax=Mytilus trossulus TaxID=6551 RepID=UPI003003FEF4
MTGHDIMASWDEKLLTAAREGNIKEVELCIKNRANLECRGDYFGMTPLMLAAERGHLEVVTYLVTHGSRLEATSTRSGRTALHYAAENGQIDTTKWLLDQGCSHWVKTNEVTFSFILIR